MTPKLYVEIVVTILINRGRVIYNRIEYKKDLPKLMQLWITIKTSAGLGK